jgi:hypothetical protein
MERIVRPEAVSLGLTGSFKSMALRSSAEKEMAPAQQDDEWEEGESWGKRHARGEIGHKMRDQKHGQPWVSFQVGIIVTRPIEGFRARRWFCVV